VPSSVVVPTTIDAMAADRAYSDDSNDDSFAPKLHQMMAAAAAAYARQKQKYAKPKRNKRRNYVRLDWHQYWEESLNDPSFEREIRMHRASFIKLVDMLREDLTVDREMAYVRGGQVCPELCVYLTIRYMCGNDYIGISRAVGISTSTVYSCLQKTLIAITNCKQLALKFPRTREECEVVAETFCNRSMGDAIVNCVGAADGYLLCIDVPSKQQAGNVRSYFSGHYKRYGINVQAVCDGNGIFSYFALSAPGSANDRVAIKENIGGIEG
jgi:DDE superfamily endonuclease